MFACERGVLFSNASVKEYVTLYNVIFDMLHLEYLLHICNNAQLQLI